MVAGGLFWRWIGGHLPGRGVFFTGQVQVAGAVLDRCVRALILA